MAFLFTGCLKNKEAECNYDPCAYKAPASEIQAVQEYLATNNITATQHCSGLFYRIENEGTGTRANACSAVLARYKGMLTDGTVFDQSPAAGTGFYLNRVIQGWTNGIPLVKAGGRVVLYIPPSLGYGNQPPPGSVIPANAILIFEVDVLDVQ